MHFRDLEHDVRKYYAARIAKANLTTAVVLIKKRDLLRGDETAAEERQRRMMLYHVATVGLIEAVSHYCTDSYVPSDPGDGTVDLVFSSRSTLDYSQLRSGIEMALADPDVMGLRKIMATAFHPSADAIKASQVQAIMHSKSMGLQIADAVTSSYYYAVEQSADEFTEDAYVRLLLPCAYRHSGELLGHGINAQFCGEEALIGVRSDLTRWQR